MEQTNKEKLIHILDEWQVPHTLGISHMYEWVKENMANFTLNEYDSMSDRLAGKTSFTSTDLNQARYRLFYMIQTVKMHLKKDVIDLDKITEIAKETADKFLIDWAFNFTNDQRVTTTEVTDEQGNVTTVTTAKKAKGGPKNKEIVAELITSNPGLTKEQYVALIVERFKDAPKPVDVRNAGSYLYNYTKANS